MINGMKYIVFLKFGEKENLEKLQAGEVYMKEIKYYRNLEASSGKAGRGDRLDSCMVQRDVPIWINGIKMPNVDLFVETNTIDEKTPVFCCSCLKEQDFLFDPVKREYIVDKKVFHIEKLKEDFGEFVLVISCPKIFLERIKETCETSNIDIRYQEVKYVDYEEKGNQWKKEYTNDLSHFFIKDKKRFEEQKEFRLLLANVFTDEGKDHYSITVPGGFKDISRIFPAEKVFTISYKLPEV